MILAALQSKLDHVRETVSAAAVPSVLTGSTAVHCRCQTAAASIGLGLSAPQEEKQCRGGILQHSAALLRDLVGRWTSCVCSRYRVAACTAQHMVGTPLLAPPRARDCSRTKTVTCLPCLASQRRALATRLLYSGCRQSPPHVDPDPLGCWCACFRCPPAC